MTSEGRNADAKYLLYASDNDILSIPTERQLYGLPPVCTFLKRYACCKHHMQDWLYSVEHLHRYDSCPAVATISTVLVCLKLPQYQSNYQRTA
jgi:hypothetical protein